MPLALKKLKPEKSSSWRCSISLPKHSLHRGSLLLLQINGLSTKLSRPVFYVDHVYVLVYIPQKEGYALAYKTFAEVILLWLAKYIWFSRNKLLSVLNVLVPLYNKLIRYCLIWEKQRCGHDYQQNSEKFPKLQRNLLYRVV